jgi:hypothetical protein
MLPFLPVIERPDTKTACKAGLTCGVTEPRVQHWMRMAVEGSRRLRFIFFASLRVPQLDTGEIGRQHKGEASVHAYMHPCAANRRP